MRRRHVFYVSGFDPKGPAHYHRLYAEQAALAAAVGGYRVEVGRRRKRDELSALWSVRWWPGRASTDGTTATSGPEPAPVETEVEFLRWDDIVRDHWPRQAAVLAWDLTVTTVLYLRTGALWRMLELAWPPVLALTAPFLALLMLVGALPLSALLGLAVARTGAGIVGGLAAALLLLACAAGLAMRAERRWNMRWLLRSYAFTGRQGTHGWPALEARLDAFARRIAQVVAESEGPEPAVAAGGGPADAPRGPIDEVLVVAHSSGGIMACAALARALALDPALTRRGPRVALLTLAHCSPMLSSLPGAVGYREELARLASEPALDWIDVTAPPDGCCFAFTDPIAAACLPVPRPDHPKLVSPRFAAAFTPERYAEIRRDRFRLHFQYLMASELPSDYDYTAITAGPLQLAERFRDQPSNPPFARFRLFGR